MGCTRTWNKEGKKIQDTDIDFKKEYGAPWYFQYRADLRAEFLRLASAPSAELGIQGHPATIRYGQKVTDVDVESGLVTLASGEKIESDLVIGEPDFQRALILTNQLQLLMASNPLYDL